MKKKRNALPEMCYVALRATSELVIISDAFAYSDVYCRRNFVEMLCGFG